MNFPARNLNFHWRWRVRIQATFRNLFYINRSISCLILIIGWTLSAAGLYCSNYIECSQASKKCLSYVGNDHYTDSSMTSLLTHTVAHSTRPSFRLKTNNQPLKKFLSLAVSWVKVVKNGKFWLSKSIFYVKNYPNLSKKNFHWWIWF